jgi:hypothetical protein
MIQHLRIARPVSDLSRSATMYCAGLGFRVLSSFENHDGFDGVMLGGLGAHYHFEFTRHRTHVVKPTPTTEDLFVLYIPEQDDWNQACCNMIEAGFMHVTSSNPYWESNGRTFEDADGYRTVLEHSAWTVEGAV